MQPKNIPRAMREAKRWIVWRKMPDKHDPSKRHKVPVQRRWNHPEQWMTFEEACERLKRGLHLGFVLGDGWAGVDVDGAWDDQRKLRPHAKTAWEACKAAYVEHSPSGGGFKAFVFDEDLPLDSISDVEDHVGTEVYHHRGRWFAVTGDVLPGCGNNPRAPKAVQGWRDIAQALRAKKGQRIRAMEVDDGAKLLKAYRRHTADGEQGLRDALSLLAADDYHDWVRFGMALKAMGWEDDEAAFQLWHEWSAKSGKYPGEGACREKWGTFEPRGGVDVSAIFANAKEAADALPEPSSGGAKLAQKLLAPTPLTELSAKELAEMKARPPRQLLPGLLAPGLTLLEGRQKSGKTYMALQLAAAIATGRLFLGVRPARPYRVKCYFLEEGGGPDLQKCRFDQMGLADWFETEDQLENLVLLFGDLEPLDGLGLERLQRDLQEYDAVIVDSSSALDHGTNGSKARDVFRRHYQELRVLQNLARKSGRCLVLLTHTRKGSTVEQAAPDDVGNATGGTVAAADAYWVLQESRKTPGLWRLTVRGRYAGPQPMALRHDRATGHWELVGDWDESIETASPAGVQTVLQRCEAAIRELLEVLSEAPTCLIQQVLSKRGMKESAVLATLRTLADRGSVERVSSAYRPLAGVGRPGSVWRLVEHRDR